MKRLFLAVAALAALVSCNRGNELVPSQNFRNVSIVAKSAETKTVLQDNAVVWEASDAIKVRFDKTDASASHFETFTTAQGGATATFAGTLPNDVSETGGYNDTGYAVYPAAAMDDNGTVSFTLPSNVTVDASGTFSASENLSSAKVSLTDLVSDGTTSANFLNAFSIIRFKLDSDVQTLKLTADAPLVGTATMVFNDEGRLVKSGDFTTPSNVLNITAPTGGFDGTTAYNILVFPGSFNTLTAEMTDKDGCTYRKENNGTYDFAINMNTHNVLPGRPLSRTKLRNPSQTMQFMDGKDAWIQYNLGGNAKLRHGTKYNMLFEDGHAGSREGSGIVFGGGSAAYGNAIWASTATDAVKNKFWKN